MARALRVSSGALIQTVAPGSSAEAAGLLATRRALSGIVAGDVIVAFEGRPIGNAADLQAALDGAAVRDFFFFSSDLV